MTLLLILPSDALNTDSLIFHLCSPKDSHLYKGLTYKPPKVQRMTVIFSEPDSSQQDNLMKAGLHTGGA